MSDEADQAAAFEERYTEAAMERVRRARQIIEEGPVICSDCGGPIPDARRAAVPGTRFCVGCQEERERPR